MKLLSTRLLVASALIVPGMLIAKPAPKKAKPKPPVEAPAHTEDAATPPPPPPPPPPARYDYGMAGCGLGTLALKEDNQGMQILAATLNGTGVQSFGITSGTSNCKPTGKALSMEQRVFIDANLVTLKREAASGKGETLTAFADLLGCQSKEFNQASQSNYQQIYSSATAESILKEYKTVMANECTRLI